MVLGHATSKNEEGDQAEWWVAEQGLLNDKEETVQSSQRGREPKRVATGVSKSRRFYGLVIGLF